jgi:hypothetical protein
MSLKRDTTGGWTVDVDRNHRNFLILGDIYTATAATELGDRDERKSNSSRLLACCWSAAVEMVNYPSTANRRRRGYPLGSAERERADGGRAIGDNGYDSMGSSSDAGSSAARNGRDKQYVLTSDSDDDDELLAQRRSATGRGNLR